MSCWLMRFCCILLAMGANGFRLDTMMNEKEFDKLVRLGQCAVQCTKKFVRRTERTLRSGQPVPYFNLSSSDEFKQCEFGCKTPYSFEQSKGFPEAFQSGRKFRDVSSNLAGNRSSPIKRVVLKCMSLLDTLGTDDQTPPSVIGLVVFELKQKLMKPVRFLIEGRMRVIDPQTNKYEEHFWGSALKDQPSAWVTEMVPTMEFRFLVTAVDENGRLGETVASEYYPALSESYRLESPVNVSVRRQIAVNNQSLNAELVWSYGDHLIAQSSCFYRVAWLNTRQLEQNAVFSLDESDGYLLPNLLYHQNYTIYLSSISSTDPDIRVEADPVGTILVAQSCRELNGPNYALCGLGAVSNLRLVSFDEKVGSALVAWLPVDNETNVAGYRVFCRSLPEPGIDVCPVVLEEQEIFLSRWATNATLELPSAGCRYVVTVFSFDGEHNWSEPAELLFVYSAPSWTGSVLLLVVGCILLTVGLVVLVVGCWRWNAELFSQLGSLRSLLATFMQEVDRSIPNQSLPFYTPAIGSPIPLATSTTLQGRHLQRERLGFDYDNEPTPLARLDFSRASANTSSAASDSTLVASVASSVSSSMHIFTAGSLRKRSQIGNGHFSRVWLAQSPKFYCDVALKEFVRDISCQRQEIDTLKVLARSDCVHIVRLLGVYHSQPNVVTGVVLELCAGGDLKKYLQNAKRLLPQAKGATSRRDSGIESPSNVTEAQFDYDDDGEQGWEPIFAHKLIDFCRQICIAMAYLSSLNYVHRDLAARNVLLLKNEPDPRAPLTTQTVKLADFGMARLLPDTENACYRPHHSRELPLKWMPPEVFGPRRNFLAKSDVWSFGALLSEVITLGNDPPQEMSKNLFGVVLPTISCQRPHLDNRLTVLRDIMVKCCKINEDDRPSFDALVDEIATILQS